MEVLEVTIAREGFGKAEAILTEMESIEWWLEVEVDKHRSGHVKKLEEKFTAKSAELKELPDPRTANAVRAFVVLGRSADVPRALGKVDWAANKRFEISKLKFKFPRARTYELIRARSRLYRSHFLQVNTRWN